MKYYYLVIAVLVLGGCGGNSTSILYECDKLTRAEAVAKKEPHCYPVRKIKSPGSAKFPGGEVDHKGEKSFLGKVGDVAAGVLNTASTISVGRAMDTD